MLEPIVENDKVTQFAINNELSAAIPVPIDDDGKPEAVRHKARLVANQSRLIRPAHDMGPPYPAPISSRHHDRMPPPATELIRKVDHERSLPVTTGGDVADADDRDAGSIPRSKPRLVCSIPQPGNTIEKMGEDVTHAVPPQR